MRAMGIAIFVVALLVVVAPVPVMAQDAAPAPTAAAPVVEPPAAPVSRPAAYNPRDYVPLGAFKPDGSVEVTDELTFQSLMFSPEEITTVVATLNRRGANARQPGGETGRGILVVPGEQVFYGEDGEVIGDAAGEVKPYYPPIPTKRVISLSGVVYRKPNDWIVWLNGHKLVPGARLPELVDIRVERDRVHLKWFDIGMAKIIALTLRPRQTYDITSGVLLTSSEAEGR